MTFPHVSIHSVALFPICLYTLWHSSPVCIHSVALLSSVSIHCVALFLICVYTLWHSLPVCLYAAIIAAISCSLDLMECIVGETPQPLHASYLSKSTRKLLGSCHFSHQPLEPNHGPALNFNTLTILLNPHKILPSCNRGHFVIS